MPLSKRWGNISAEIERLAAAAADPNCTASEKAAYQASIDGMLDSIDSIISTAEFNGTDLFTGVTAGTSGNAIKAADSGNGNITDIAVYSRDNSMSADKTMVVDATDTGAVTVDGNAATCEIIKKDDGTDSNFARIHYTNGDYSLSFTIDTTGAAADDEITITNGGGAKFQLGSDTDTRKVLDMGAGITTSELGSGVLNTAGDGWAGKLSSLRSGGTNSLTATNSRAAEIAKASSQQVAVSRARIGNFNNYQIGSSLNTLQAAKEGMMDAYDNVAKTDYTEAASELDSQQILMNAAISVLSIANSQQNYALSLLQ